MRLSDNEGLGALLIDRLPDNRVEVICPCQANLKGDKQTSVCLPRKDDGLTFCPACAYELVYRSFYAW